MDTTATATASKKIQKAIRNIIIQSGWWGSQVIKLDYVEDTACPTAWTDGIQLGYNPLYINSLGIQYVEGLLVHEVLHCVLGHPQRVGNRDSRKYNIAADYVVNLIIQGSTKYQLPSGALLDDQYVNMSTEAVYNILPDSDDADATNKTSRSGADSDGDVRPTPVGKIDDARAKWSDARTALDKSTDNDVKGIREALDLVPITDSTTDSMDILREYMAPSPSSQDYSWSRPNKRSSSMYLPSLQPQPAIGCIVLAVDISGSIDMDALGRFVNTTNSILSSLPHQTSVVVLTCDDTIRSSHTYDSVYDYQLDNPLSRCRGGGGTDYSPVYNWIRDNMDTTPNVMVYLTDLECTTYGTPGDYPVLWVVSTDKYKDPPPPYGKVIKI